MVVHLMKYRGWDLFQLCVYTNYIHLSLLFCLLLLLRLIIGKNIFVTIYIILLWKLLI